MLRTAIGLLIALATAAPALAQNVPVTTTHTGLSGDAIATAALSDPIDMEAQGKRTNQLALTVEVTPGTTTRIRVTCYESSSKTNGYAQVCFCNTTSPSTCKPDLREFTLSDYATVSGKKYIKTHWGIREQWAKCSVVDPDGGSGTVSVYGTRSWQ